jgi:hypothetical protein
LPAPFSPTYSTRLDMIHADLNGDVKHGWNGVASIGEVAVSHLSIKIL